MAAISAALIAGTAVTASTIAAGAATLASVGGAAMSFSQAGQAKAKAADATQAANKAIAEAKSKLDLNFYDTLGIQKEPYELQREALLASGAQAIEAGRESERGAAATAGRVQMAQNEAQAGVRTAMGQELTALEKLSAAEDSRLRDVGAQINLQEAEGAQLARANFETLAGQSRTQGMQGLVQGSKSLVSTVPEFMKQKGIDPNTGLKIVPPKPTPDATNKTVTATNASNTAVTQAVAAPVAQAAAAPTTTQTTDGQAVADLTPMPTTQAVNPASIDPTNTPTEVAEFRSLTGSTEPSAEFKSNMAMMGFKWNPTTKQFER
jgi:VIT1/CCC1 family predicted Fe2+/Mn2+ transporter